MATTSPSFTAKRGLTHHFLTVTYLSLSLLAAYYMRIYPDTWAMSTNFSAMVDARKFPQNGMPLRTSYTGWTPLDTGLSFLVAAFMPGCTGWDRGFYLQVAHFLVQCFAIVGVMSVEGCRGRHVWSVVNVPALWALFYQTVGGAIIIPLYFLAHHLSSSGPNYYDPSTRPLQISRARTLLPALLVGYLLPTILLMVPWPLDDDKQFACALWQPCPLFVSAFHYVFTSMDSFSHPVLPKDPEKVDLKYLRRIYGTGFVISALSHFVVLGISLTSTDPELGLYRIFMPDFGTGKRDLTQSLFFVFQIDWWIIFAAVAVWCVDVIGDLRVLGKTSLNVVSSAVLVVGGMVVLGPGAVLSAVWWWREGKMSEIGGVGKGKKA